jgi:preprotein translocase subunit SecG
MYTLINILLLIQGNHSGGGGGHHHGHGGGHYPGCGQPTASFSIFLTILLFATALYLGIKYIKKNGTD